VTLYINGDSAALGKGPFYRFNTDHLGYTFACLNSIEFILKSDQIMLITDFEPEKRREDLGPALVFSFSPALFRAMFLVINESELRGEFICPLMWEGRYNV